MFTVIVYLMLSLHSIDIQINLDAKAELFAVDNLGNCYVYANDVLQKYSASGKLQYSYSNTHTGQISLIDVSDPMQIMLYYKDFEQVVFLDNTLNLLGEVIELNSLETSNIATVCKSRQSSIWIYDDYENELILYAYNKRRIVRRIKLNFLENNSNKVNFMLEDSALLYLNESNTSIRVFDIFGNEQNKLPVKTVNDFQVIKGNVLCKNGYFNTVTKSSVNIENVDNIKYSNGTFYILTDKSIKITDSYNKLSISH